MNVLLFGLGRIGLPQALTLSKAGHSVVGVDHDSDLVDQINSGSAPFFEPGLDDLLIEAIDLDLFKAVQTDALSLPSQSSDVIVISVGYAVTSSSEEFVRAIASNYIVDLVGSNPLNRPLILIRSTVPVGTTQLFSAYMEEQHGLVESEHYYLAHLPERIAEGVAISEEWSLPKLVGAASAEALSVVEELFAGFDAKVVRLPSAAHTEFGKLVENSWRDLTFAFSNDIAMLAEELEVDVEPVLSTLNFQYPRNSIPYPGPVSGYCLSKDPLILDSMRASSQVRFGDHDTLSGFGRSVNVAAIGHIVTRVVEALDGVTAPEVAILGLSFKPDVDDYRESHGLEIANSILDAIPDVMLRFVDPYLDSNRYTTLPLELTRRPHVAYSTIESLEFSQLSAMVISTPHNADDVQRTSSVLKSALLNSEPLKLVYDSFGTYSGSALSTLPQYSRLGKPFSPDDSSGLTL